MVTREVKVETSVQVYAKVALEAAGWTEDRLDFMEEFPFEEFNGDLLRKSYVAFGFNFDDGGQQAELGSNLRRRIYTLEFFVFGQDELNAKSVANELKFAIDVEERIPLLDIGEPDTPLLDWMLVKSCHAQKVSVVDPKPHERHVYLTTAAVEDEYYPATQ